MTTIQCFYMAPADLLVPRTGEKIEVGRTARFGGDPVLCECGLHASIHVLDTLEYRSTGLLTLVEVGGVIVEGTDKIAGQTRRTLAILDRARTDRVLREIACVSAELALQWVCFDRGVEPDQRSIDAIDVARRFARGEASAGELGAAWAAAWDAARAAAGAAAGAAARAAAGAAARDAAWAAAWDAARAAAWDAARDAARAAARDAARAAAWAAAWDAARAAAWDAARAAAGAAAGDAIHNVADRMALGALTKRVRR